MKKLKPLQIGSVAKQSQTSVHTIRYYEKLGLLKTPARGEGGFRLYFSDTVEKLIFIKKAQGFGLTLKEIKKIMVCGNQGLEPCCDLTTNLFTQKIDELEDRIQELEGMKGRLKSVLSGWVKPKSKKDLAS
jgi:MerR family copper efflux transcriptional regulator